MIGANETPLPPHKKELIEWLSGFRGTADLIAILQRYQITPEEAASWRRQMEAWLIPEAANQKEVHHARSLG